MGKPNTAWQPYQLPNTLFNVMYWDRDWNELVHLRLEAAGSLEVLEALKSWFVERDKIRADKLAMSVLADAVAISIGGYYEQN